MNLPNQQTTIYLSVLNDFFEWSMLIGIKHCIWSLQLTFFRSHLAYIFLYFFYSQFLVSYISLSLRALPSRLIFSYDFHPIHPAVSKGILWFNAIIPLFHQPFFYHFIRRLAMVCALRYNNRNQFESH